MNRSDCGLHKRNATPITGNFNNQLRYSISLFGEFAVEADHYARRVFPDYKTLLKVRADDTRMFTEVNTPISDVEIGDSSRSRKVLTLGG